MKRCPLSILAMSIAVLGCNEKSSSPSLTPSSPVVSSPTPVDPLIRAKPMGEIASPIPAEEPLALRHEHETGVDHFAVAEKHRLLGDVDLAMDEYQRALADDPLDEQAL